MNEVAWLASADAGAMLTDLPRTLRNAKSAMPEAERFRRLRLFSCAVCRRLWHLLNDNTRRAIVLAELYADEGQIQLLRNALAEYHTGWNEDAEAAQQIEFDGPARARLESECRSEAISAVKSLTIGHAAGSTRARVEAERALALEEYLIANRDVELLAYPNPFPTTSPTETALHAHLVRDIFGNPFRPVAFDPAWRTDTAVALARTMYDSREFGAMPILADALQDAGCEDEQVLNHCRGPGPHVRGCWVCDLVLGLS